MRLASLPMRVARSLSQRVGRLYSVRDNVSLGRNVHVGIGTTLWAPDRLEVAEDVYIGKRCTIEVNGSIGRGCLLANDVGLVGRYDHDHRSIGLYIRHAPWVGTSVGDTDDADHAVIIEADCWIGFGAVVLSGVTVERGSIVSAGAVVVTSVPPYSIVAGCPARVVGARFTSAEIIEHERRLEVG